MFRERKANYFLSWRGDFRPDPIDHIQVKFPLHHFQKNRGLQAVLGSSWELPFPGVTQRWHQARWSHVHAVRPLLTRQVLPSYLATGGGNQHSVLWPPGEEPSRLKLQKSHEHFLPSSQVRAALVGIKLQISKPEKEVSCYQRACQHFCPSSEQKAEGFVLACALLHVWLPLSCCMTQRLACKQSPLCMGRQVGDSDNKTRLYMTFNSYIPIN